MEHLPTLKQLQYLLALADHRNFQKAANACNITQSTLSAALKDLEETLRAPVIDRTQRKLVRFTPLGEDILQSARDIIAQMESLTCRARSLDKPLSWPLRLAVIPTIAPYLLPRLMGPLSKTFPKLELHIHEMRSGQLVEKIHDGTIDFALMAFPFDTKGLHEMPIKREDFLCAAPPGHFTNKRTVTMKDLQSEKLLLLEDGHCLRDQTLDACKTQKLSENKTFSAASLSTLIQMVHQGYGVTMLPRMAVDNQVLPKNLTLRPFKGETPHRTIGLAWKKNSLREKDIALLATAIKKLI